MFHMNMRKLSLAGFCLVVLAACAEVSAQTRIQFARGRTSATVSGTINKGAGRTFVLRANNGQFLSANVSSRNDCVNFNNGATSTSFITRAGDNILYLTNRCRNAAPFTLTVSINYGSD
jgi:hypothetical protein